MCKRENMFRCVYLFIYLFFYLFIDLFNQFYFRFYYFASKLKGSSIVIFRCISFNCFINDCLLYVLFFIEFEVIYLFSNYHHCQLQCILL